MCQELGQVAWDTKVRAAHTALSSWGFLSRGKGKINVIQIASYWVRLSVGCPGATGGTHKLIQPCMSDKIMSISLMPVSTNSSGRVEGPHIHG